MDVSTFKPTRLIIKRHSVTRLLYFCKSVREDIERYKGSGSYWRNHIKVHGRQFVENVWVSDWFYDATEIKDFALSFSELFNIVESDEWANLRPEDGLSGGDTSHTENYKSKSHLFSQPGEKNPMFGKTWKWSDDQKLAVTGENHPAYGTTWTDEEREKRSGENAFWFGKKRPDVSGKNHYESRSVVTPLGQFDTVTDAAKAHGVTRTIIRRRTKKYPSEYRYVNPDYSS